MPLKADAPATDWEVVDRWDGGVGWIAHPDELIRRASHALAVDGEVWVVDPVDAPGLDDLLAEYGDVAGVVVTLGRHQRDADAVALRHDVPVYLPPTIDRAFDARVERFDEELADTGFRALEILDVPGWHEVALYDGRTLVCGDALGTANYFLAGGERVGVYPVLRVAPPRRVLAGLAPERILVGHGEGVFEGADEALDYALRHARRNAPAAWWNGLKRLL